MQNLQNPFVNAFDLVQSAYDTLSSANSRAFFCGNLQILSADSADPQIGAVDRVEIRRFGRSANRCCTKIV